MLATGVSGRALYNGPKVHSIGRQLLFALLSSFIVSDAVTSFWQRPSLSSMYRLLRNSSKGRLAGTRAAT